MSINSTRIICPLCGEIDKSLVKIYNINLRKQNFALSPILATCKQCTSEIEIKDPPKGAELIILNGTCGSGKSLCAYMNPKGVFGDAIVGICFGVNATDKDFPYVIGVAYEDGDIASDLTIEEIPALTWAIFKCTGAMPNAIQELWLREVLNRMGIHMKMIIIPSFLL